MAHVPSIADLILSALSSVVLTSFPLFLRYTSIALLKMAEPIGIASGLLTLAAFAFQSSISLYQAVESFQSNQRIIRGLKEELEALNVVLESLNQVAASNSADLTGLNLPLLSCGKACKDFEAVIVKCTMHSGGSRTSFRDWAKLKYMGGDIAGFKNMLAGYKSTISIALGDATLYISQS